MTQLAFGSLLIFALFGSVIAAFATGNWEFLAVTGFSILLLRAF